MKLNIIWSVLRSLALTQKRPQTQASTVQANIQRPPDNDTVAWPKYWKERGQPWRREPEISEARKRELAKLEGFWRGSEKYVSRFFSCKLSRADIEWLIEDAKSTPLDLEDAILEGEDLRYLPLTGANFRYAQLNEASLAGAQLKNSDFSNYGGNTSVQVTCFHRLSKDAR